MRRLLIIFAMALLPSVAVAAHGMGGGGGGHMGGGWGGGHMGGGWGGGHMGGGWGGARMGGSWSGARMGGSWSGARMGGGWGGRSMAMVPGRMGSWHGANWHRGPFFHRGRFFVRRHNRFFFAGAPFFAAYGFGYGSDCWSWVPTSWGPRRVWVCGDFY